MPLYLKKFRELQREMYLYYPGEENRTPFKRCSITILMDDCNAQSIEKLLTDWKLEELANEKEIVLCFPVPLHQRWGAQPNKDAYQAEMKHILATQSQMDKLDDRPIEVDAIGIPTLEEMLRTWHPMNDTKYLIGLQSGSDLACTLAAQYPQYFAAVFAQGGSLRLHSIDNATYAPMPIWLSQPHPDTLEYFQRANDVKHHTLLDGLAHDTNDINPLNQVFVKNQDMDAALLHEVWARLFSKVRRTNTCIYGDIEPRMEEAKTIFECVQETEILGDGRRHTWFVHLPPHVKTYPQAKLPLVLFFHGGSDNPTEAAEMSKFHELGQTEGFITVYPWGTNRCGWNCSMLSEQEDDVSFCARLIDHMIAHYPVDQSRVYLSGFSNGAAMAQALALVHPEKVAAICHIDSNWPGIRGGYQIINEDDVIPFRLGMEKKKEYDYRIPVWYTYGSREASYPVYRGSTQQNQYDFWKKYNGIEVKHTPAVGESNPTGCGVQGDKRDILYPSERHPKHFYDVQRFYCLDDPTWNYYNYVVMHDKGHDVAQMDAALGWAFVKQFRRMTDGSLQTVKESELPWL